jgi:hypothetical protein
MRTGEEDFGRIFPPQSPAFNVKPPPKLAHSSISHQLYALIGPERPEKIEVFSLEQHY